MTLDDIISAAKLSEQVALDKMSEKYDALLVRKVLQQIAAQVGQAGDDEVVKVLGLGNFKVKMFSSERDGSTVEKRRVIFTPSPVRTAEG